MKKGDSTRASILAEALALANRDGLQGLTIGAIADRCEMSKSGVFAHFGSREELQIAVVGEYHQRFQTRVFTPAMGLDKGVKRFKGLFNNWVAEVSHEVDAGSIYISGAVEFDEREGAVREALVYSITTWQAALVKAVALAQQLGQFRSDAQPEQIVYEVHGLILALHHDARFLRRPESHTRAQVGFERLMQHYLV